MHILFFTAEAFGLEENNRFPLPDRIEIKENVYKSNMQARLNL
jgi:hypothetical protein